MLDLLGFSQGAALAGALTLIYPRRVRSLGLLSGFLPTAINANPADNSLNGLRVFIAHGTLDDRVPIRHARQAAATLQKAGAQVEFCEANVGHKLGLPCFKALESFFMRSN
jgi:phospholipase/carboxylesterase